MKNSGIRILVAGLWLSMLSFVFVGCGVRGRPQPPLTPPEIGRGQPSFKRATEEYAFPEVPKAGATPQRKTPEKDGK